MKESILVLCVGDEPLVKTSEHLERRVEDVEFDVVTASTARTGLDVLEDGDVDAVVSGYDLPDESGLEFLETLRNRHPDLPFVLFVGDDTEATARDAISAGATDCFRAGPEPERYDLLATRIENAVKRRRAERHLERVNDFTPPQLYEVTTDTSLTLEEQIERVLEIGLEEFGYAVGYFTRIHDGVQVIRSAAGGHDVVQPGRTDPLEQTYCRRAIESDEPVVVSDALEEGWADDPAYETFELRCYVGARVEVGDETYGTFCFGDKRPRDPDVIHTQKSTVKLLAQWIGYELEREEYKRELERQNERLEEFVSAVSHDLRNPLDIARGYLDLLEAGLEDGGAGDHLETIDRALDRMNVLIEDTLTLAREGRRVDEFDDVSLAAVASASWEIVETDGAALEIVEDLTLRADERRLRRVFENLFRNAIEHSGAEVTVEVGSLESGAGFYVADDGPGIDPKERDRIFDRGYSSSESTGFGLAIVEGIVTAHGWGIDVTESESGGARFEIRGETAEQRLETELGCQQVRSR